MKNYLKSIMQEGTVDSSKRFAMIISIIVSAIIGLSIAFALIYDVCENGYLKTNLNEIGMLLLGLGGYVAGGSVSKVVADSKKDRPKTP